MQALQHIEQLLLTRDRVQRRWLSQSALAWLLMGLGVLTMQYAAWQGNVERWVVLCWGSVTLGGLALAYLSIRRGWSRRWRDPALLERVARARRWAERSEASADDHAFVALIDAEQAHAHATESRTTVSLYAYKARAELAALEAI